MMDKWESNSVRDGIAAGRDVELTIQRYAGRDFYDMRVRVAVRPCPVCEARLLGESMEVCAHCAERRAQELRSINITKFVCLTIACCGLLTVLFAWRAPPILLSAILAGAITIAWHEWGVLIVERFRALFPRPTP